jgi:LysM repeat protein
LSENAARCLVCGAEFSARPEAKAVRKAEKSVQASRMPVITLSLPAAVGALAVVIVIAAAVAFFSIKAGGGQASLEGGDTPTPSLTPTITPSPTPTLPPTAVPSPTEIPPFEYTVSASDGGCLFIAGQFHVSVQSIVILNNLSSDCLIHVGDVLKIPYPTATPPPPPTSTSLPANATEEACEKVQITVQGGDTLSTISANYGVSAQAIKDFNGLTTDSVFTGTTLKIPLCMRAATPGASSTPTIPPPYPAPNLLLPADGAAFTLANDVVTLQWASVGVLRDAEAYQIIVEDVTADQTRRLTDYVTDTKYIVPTSFRPKDNVAHVLRWWITPMRQTGADDQGQPIWVIAGATSEKRVFTWVGIAVEGTPSQ